MTGGVLQWNICLQLPVQGAGEALRFSVGVQNKGAAAPDNRGDYRLTQGAVNC